MKTINNAQRKALCKIVRDSGDKRVKTLKDLRDEEATKAFDAAKDELGITGLDQEAAVLETRLREIVKQKEVLGLIKYGGQVSGGKVGDIVTKTLAKRNKQIADLESTIDKAISRIWTHPTLTDAERTVNDILTALDGTV